MLIRDPFKKKQHFLSDFTQFIMSRLVYYVGYDRITGACTYFDSSIGYFSASSRKNSIEMKEFDELEETYGFSSTDDSKATKILSLTDIMEAQAVINQTCMIPSSGILDTLKESNPPTEAIGTPTGDVSMYLRSEFDD